MREVHEEIQIRDPATLVYANQRFSCHLPLRGKPEEYLSSIGETALSGDLSKPFNILKLRPEYWHLQLFLWQAELDPNNMVDIAVIKNLIYGNSASVPLSEESMRQLAALVREHDPELADVLTNGRLVDDPNKSTESIQAALRLKTAVDDAFTKLGVKIKGWAVARYPPVPEISENGYVDMAWHTETDTLELKLNDLHFGKAVRWRLNPSTPTFKGDIKIHLWVLVDASNNLIVIWAVVGFKRSNG
jgi:hypothetical protein